MIIKEIDHGDWKEYIHESGMIAREGNIPDHLEHEFYRRYKPRAARIVHRDRLPSLIGLEPQPRSLEE